MDNREKITVKISVARSVTETWESWTEPKHIVNWNFASDDWCCPSASNDLRAGGKFTARMEACDGSMGFDFGGEYLRVEPFKLIEYHIGDGRNVLVEFVEDGNQTMVTETFEAEGIHSVEMQKAGWQSILDNFRKYTESL
jgi:uncharacterized protein YndB with AHSA1/START domain